MMSSTDLREDVLPLFLPLITINLEFLEHVSNVGAQKCERSALDEQKETLPFCSSNLWLCYFYQM